eukprot:9097323-Pyramimonas_sp.AAC.1
MDALHLVIDAFVAEEQKAQGVIMKQKTLFGEEQQSEPRKFERADDDRPPKKPTPNEEAEAKAGPKDQG